MKIKFCSAKNKGTGKIRKAIITIALVSLFVTGLVSGLFTNIIVADEPAQTYDIRSAEEFIAYSQAYATGSRNPKDVLKISINTGSVVTDDGFISLGTSSRPFAGTLIIPTAGIDVFHLFNCPLFDFVSTDLTITGAGVVKINRERANELPDPGVLTSGSLFANHVVAGENPANWSVTLLPYEGEGREATDFDSVIGEIGSKAIVSITFTNNSSLNVVGTGNVGLLCGTLNSGATLNAVTAGSGSSISVSTTGGHAGGLVGQMKQGAVLNLNSGNNSKVNSVSTTGAKYAGGIVGYVENVTTDSGVFLGSGITDYVINGSVTGKSGAGGLFGYYKNTSGSDTFTLEDTYKITDVSIGSSGETGGIFGALVSETETFSFEGNGHDNQELFSVMLNSGNSKGGLAGSFETNSLENSLYIRDFKPSVTTTVGSSAGLIGVIAGDVPVYVLVDGDTYPIEIGILGSADAGLIADMGDKGSFLDTKGTIKITGTCHSGLVDKMTDGVMRLKGETDLSGCTSTGATLINERGTALVYSVGSGSDANWTFKRNATNAVDDIKSWGEVVRTGATGFTENDIFVSTGHTVQVKSAPDSYAIGSASDFARMALNIQLNTSGTKGALQFASGDSNTSSVILTGDLSLTADVSLVGTGLTGLTRDNDKNDAFSGTFNGHNNTLTFSTGEVYGKDGNGNVLTSSSNPGGNRGNIYTHTYNGLFAKINGGSAAKGKVYDLNLTGNFYMRPVEGIVKLGGVAASVTGFCTIENVDSNITIEIKSHNVEGYYGGAIGLIGTNSTVSIRSGDNGIKPTVRDISTETGNSNPTFVGGVIGCVSGSASEQKVTFKDGSVIGLNYSKTDKNARTSAFGAAIAIIGGNTNYSKNSRKITFEDSVSIDIMADGSSASNQRFGGILGCVWHVADIEINNLVVSNAEITANSNANFGGLVQTATGHWDINSISLTENNAVFDLPGGTFGFVANKTYYNNESKSCALYLDIDNTGSNYDISDLTFSGTPSFSVFDEIVADSRFDGSDITNNGQSIISISTSGETIDSAVSTYLNKTAYGIEHKSINANTRYYYNLEPYRDSGDSATNAQKFLIWSVKQYSHSSLESWFTKSSFSGNLDMTGLSYYPIDLTTDVTFTNAVVTLDNSLMENYVKLECSGGNGERSTRDHDNQHYLMHTALFRNATNNNIAIAGNNGLTLKGNVPNLSDSFCGFIVAGNFGGSDTKNVSLTATKITVEGARITNVDGSPLTTMVYAPLLINKIGKNTNTTINSALQNNPTAQANYGLSSGQYAASSLIGDVGDSDARSIYLTFLGLKFDGRLSKTSIGNLDDAYGTNKSIFSRATILNSFQFAGEGLATYNYELSEDWTGSSTAVHNVTYGKEITSSIEYAGQEKKYLNSESYYTHPTDYQSGSEYSFATGFLPYVYDAWDNGSLKTNHHEIRVNISVSTDAIVGCGKYSDPFIISTGGQLEYVSKVIQGVDINTETKITLPSTLKQGTDCPKSLGNVDTDYVYNFNGTAFVSSGHSNKSLNDVREYLAGAYYVITQNIELSEDYVALGTASSDDAKYAFRGLLIGRNTKITNKSDKPLIATSVGAVIKDLTIDVKGDSPRVITLAPTAGNQTYSYSTAERIIPYGAVIGQILGGDNIIDNVEVQFSDVTISISQESGKYERLTPVGGYVGVLLNGGLVFRNMTSSYVGLTEAVFDKVEDEGYLYVNPIIGRVIAGYAFHETSVYAITSATIPNTVTINSEPFSKNYTISDLSLSAGKLTITEANSQYTISVPDGQAIYILGAIVNSGAGSAATGGNLTNSIKAYRALSEYWQAYRKFTASRANATYNYVGKNNEPGYNADLTNSHGDIYAGNDLKLVPYIVKMYTTNDNSALYARSITTRDNNVVKLTGNCDVAAGFRGIGSIYLDSDNEYVRLRISEMSGRIGDSQNSYTVNLHMNFLEYNHKYVSKYIATASKTSPASTAGFGLFSRLQMKDRSSENSVQYIELSGSVFYDVYTIQGEKVQYNFAYYGSSDRTEGGEIATGDSDDVTQRRTILSVGGLAGVATNNNFYVKNVTFNNLSVEGAKSAGGLIGFVHVGDNSGSTIEYDDAGVNKGYVNVVAGLQAGGLIGRIYRTKVEIKGASGGTDIIIKNIESKNSDPDENLTKMTWGANMNTGVGGLVGTCWATDKNNNGTGSAQDSGDKPDLNPLPQTALRKLFIDNINLIKGSDPAYVRVLKDSGSKSNYAGGFIGSVLNTWVQITNSSVKSVNVEANIAGGFVGKMTQKYYMFLENVKIEGTSPSSCAIRGTRYAGGAVGWAIGRDVMYFQLLSYEISNYTVESTTKDQIQAGAGGAVGYIAGNNVVAGNSDQINTSQSYICEFNNLVVSNCVVKTKYKDKTDNYLKFKCGTGGMIGVIHRIYNDGNTNTNKQLLEDDTNDNDDKKSDNRKYKLSGYNILIKDTELIHSDGGEVNKNHSTQNRRIGDLVGNNAVGSTLKFVGVSVQNTGYADADTNKYCGKHVGYYNDDGDNYGKDSSAYGKTGGYVVFANFNASSGNETASAVTNNVDVNATSADVAIKYPFVTVNPSITLAGGVKITGDGVATSKSGLSIYDIKDDYDENGTSAIYYYAAYAYYSGSSGDKNIQAFNSDKIVMFSNEVAGYLGTDFPVFIVDDNNANRQLNAYLRLLTNTLHDFGTDKTGEYRVNIYNLTYNEGSFVVQDYRYASLKHEDGEFRTNIRQFDSGKTQFSLIDVQFFNPADTTTVAYHLYVPVFVRKVLTYSFDISVLSNTNYLKNLYTGRIGQALIENVGTPVTMYFRYTYSRTASEWEDAINAGENVHNNYVKSLLFYSANTNSLLSDYPDDTILVLVDKKSGTPYYGRFGDVFSEKTINLSMFKSIMTYSDGVYQFAGESFAPDTLDSLMTMSVSNSGEGRKLVQCAENSATVVVNSQGYRQATDEELNNSSIVKYKVSVSSIDSEEYYLSIFTESNAQNDELFHYYIIQSPSSFSDGDFPSKISDTGSHTMVHLIMGKIFHHDDLAVSSNSKQGLVMSDSNNELTIGLSAQLGLADSLDEELKTDVQNLINATEVYQSFVLYLNRKVNGKITEAILGDPTLSGEFNVDYTLNGIADTATAEYSTIRKTQGYAELVTGDLRSYFATGNKFEINATVTMTYSEIAIPAQFPGRGEVPPSDDNGVSVSAHSNIAFEQSATTYSKNSISEDETPAKWYYSEAPLEDAVLDLNPIGDRVGDLTPLGVNALNINGQPGTSAQFDLLAVLNVEPVLDEIEGYTQARITVALSQKQNDKSYGGFLDISNYMSMTYEGIPAADVTDNDTSYVILIDREDLDDNIVDITIPILHCTVITGEDFEAMGLTYGNYKVTVKVELIKSNGSIVCCEASNYVIYTNAKVNTTIE